MELLLRALSRLPFPALYALSSLLYAVNRLAIRYRYDVVEQNLRNAFPEKSDEEIARLTEDVFRNLADLVVEAIKGITVSPQALAERIVFEDTSAVDELIATDRPFILVAAHHCNWEWPMLAFCQRLKRPMTAVYQPLHNQWVNAFMLKTRARFGATPISNKNVLGELARRKKEIGALALVADQLPTRGEELYWTRFLNQDTAFYVGIEKLARITRFPVVFLHIRRLARGRYAVRFKLLAEPPYARDERRIVERYARESEAMILADPAAWLWSHQRWKYKKPVYA
ncbi:MAG: lysophospholipid acyltransferase family protein [Gammaproteobacteria bacterium]|nr:lysophospholipid acyltransferase family protein [Gammaproteobacteria bacterium]